MNTSRLFFLVAACFGLVAHALAELRVVVPASSAVWRRCELQIDGVPAAENNFDPDVIRLDAEIVTPSGRRVSMPAFWTKGYSSQLVNGGEVVQETGDQGWRVRFVPEEPGLHRVTLQLSQQRGPAVAAATAEFTVAATPAAGPTGWLRVRSDRRSFETTDGKLFRPIGENICWASYAGTENYREWFDALQRSGQNTARLWMCPWWLNLEQTENSLTRYNLDAAWRLDRIFELAEERGIYLILCLDFHGMYQVDNPHWGGSGNWWKRNPYHQSRGGPGVHPNDFFTDARAKALYQKRLRYLLARFSASTHLFAWQFFNEIDNVYAPHLLQAADVAAWHAEMGRWLKANDPYKHLVTTSLTGGSDRPEIWSLPEMDFSVYHSYGDPAPAKWLSRLSADHVQRYQKPTITGEYGVDWRGWGGRTVDPHLRAQRQALWGTALSSAAGPALSWWWEEIHADNVYPIYRAFTSILTRAGWREGEWNVARLSPALTDAPTTVSEPRAGGLVFSGPVALNDVSWLNLPARAAITGPLAAARASEVLSRYVGGTAQRERRKTVRLEAWWNADARVKLKVSDSGGAAELVVRVDGQEQVRSAILPTAVKNGTKPKLDLEFSATVPAGRHVVEIENVGEQWLYLEQLHVQGVVESEFADSWKFDCEPVGLRQGNCALLYVVSPWAVYPAGAQVYRPPLFTGAQVALHDWPAGRFVVRWFDPETGAELSHAEVQAQDGVLRLNCPAFAVDLAVLVEPAT